MYYLIGSLTVIFILIILFTILRLSKEKRRRTEAESYLAAMEKILGKFRNVRHQYNNLFQSVIFYIENEQWDQMKDFKNEIMENTSAINKSDELQVLKIRNYKIRSLILKMAETCEKFEIDFHFMVSGEIDHFNLDETAICKVMEAFFDHILGEAIRSSKKEIIIQASSESQGVAVLFFSTFDSRPSRMVSAEKILNRNKNVVFNDYTEDEYYVQELMIINDNKNTD
jgi:hypothetical protein